MRSGLGQNILDNPSGEFSGSLVLLEDNGYFETRMYIFAAASIWHSVSLSTAIAVEWKLILPERISSLQPLSILFKTIPLWLDYAVNTDKFTT